MPDNLLLNGEIYNAGKNFTLPPVVPDVTILTSVFTLVALFHTGYTAQIALEQKGYYACTYDGHLCKKTEFKLLKLFTLFEQS